jgi:transketolase
MRREFAEHLFNLMAVDTKLFVVTADLGYGMWDKIRNNYPSRFVNYGAAEIGALAFCVGLSYKGYKPIFYSITPFALWRPAEIIRNYLNHEGAEVLISLSGRGTDYKHDGWSHDATDAPDFIKLFPAINYYEPTEDNVIEITNRALNNLPAIISLSR